MKKLLWILVLSLFYFNIALSQSLLPKCDGSKNNVNKFSLKHPNEMGTFKKWKEYLKHYKKSRKWTNCYGIGLGPRGEKYVGEWQKGKFHGQGTFTYDGRTYVGEWKKGEKHGKGTFTSSDGKIKKGIWKKNKFVK